MFNSSRTIFNDFESLGTQLSFRYGLSKRDTLEIHFRHVSIFGGFLDKFIEDFHRLFKFPDANRRLYPQFSTQYRYFDSFSYTRRQSTMLPIVVSYLKEIYSSPAFSLKTRAAVGIPIADKPGLSSSKIFVTAGLLTGFKTKNFSVDVGNYLSLVGRPKWIPKEDIGHFLLNSNIEAYWYRFIAGFSFRTSVFKRGDISHNGYQCFVGYRVTRFLEFIILEDFAPFDTTPDISFNIRVKVI